MYSVVLELENEEIAGEVITQVRSTNNNLNLAPMSEVRKAGEPPVFKQVLIIGSKEDVKEVLDNTIGESWEELKIQEAE